jgi:hypothetical protein
LPYQEVRTVSSLQVRIVAYDMLGDVSWSVNVQDWDQMQYNSSSVVYSATGTMRGVGEAHPTRWLRGLLEEIREAL